MLTWRSCRACLNVRSGCVMHFSPCAVLPIKRSLLGFVGLLILLLLVCKSCVSRGWSLVLLVDRIFLRIVRVVLVRSCRRIIVLLLCGRLSKNGGELLWERKKQVLVLFLQQLTR